MRELLCDHLTSKGFLDRGFTTRTRLDIMLREHQAGRRDNSTFLWLLLILELWLSDHSRLAQGAQGSLSLLTSTSL